MKILTFDIEDWFHILDNPETKYPVQWEKFESRINIGIEIIFKLLEEFDLKATFFCLGWIGEKYPEIIKRISEAGHEIGSHTFNHRLLYELEPDEFREDLRRSIYSLEDLSGKKIKSFRAPGFSITKSNLWVIEILIQEGIEIDCSIFPAKRSHGGLQSFEFHSPVWIDYEGNKIKEFPINVKSIMNKNFIYSGGGYFRLLPKTLLKKLFDSNEYVMTYFHPRDFDSDQPIVPGLNLLRRFKSYYGLKSTEEKLRSILKDQNLTDLSTADLNYNWNKADTVYIKSNV